MTEEEKARMQQWFEDESDPLAPARGVVNGIIASTLMWALIAVTLGLIFGWFS